MNGIKKYVIWIGCLMLTACAMWHDDNVIEHASQNKSSRVRFLVLHFTTIDFATSLRVLTQPSPDGHSVSSHYLVPEEGDASYGDKALKVYQLVDEHDRAWHAGPGKWEDREYVNDQSIGIEIVNRSECASAENVTVLSEGIHNQRICFFPDYSQQQLSLLVSLVRDILKRYPDISATRVVGHADVLPAHKNDPGPRFPWQWLSTQGIGAWYDFATVTKYWKVWREQPVDILLLQRALAAYGYGIEETGVLDEQTSQVLWAFQAHFLPWEYHGQASPATLATVLALVEKYFPEKLAGLSATRATNG